MLTIRLYLSLILASFLSFSCAINYSTKEDVYKNTSVVMDEYEKIIKVISPKYKWLYLLVMCRDSYKS